MDRWVGLIEVGLAFGVVLVFCLFQFRELRRLRRAREAKEAAEALDSEAGARDQRS
jgi:hypothetical protein